MRPPREVSTSGRRRIVMSAVTEFEVKALEIDPADITERIRKAGGFHVADLRFPA